VDYLSSCLSKRGVCNEIVALCVTQKWKPSTHFRRTMIGANTLLVWPSCRLGPLVFATKRMLRMHFLPIHVSALRKHMEGFDVLHFHDDIDLSLPTFLLGSGKPRVFTFHSIEMTFRFYRANQLARSVLLKSADLFHVFSEVQREELQKLGIGAENIRVVPHGVDVDAFRPPASEFPREAVRIVWVGRIERTKGLITLLEAVRILKETAAGRGGIDVQIVGGVWQPEYYSDLLSYKTRMGLDEVRFMGLADRDRVRGLLQQADIFVLPSLTDTFPIVNLEAMASGLPIVASAVGGVRDEVADGETGFLVPPNDPKDLAEKLSALIADAKLRRRMGQAGRRRAEQLFSMDAIATKMLAIYAELT
jgi:glycosyltransferase involved in cell wall biosynthesis